MDPVVSDDRGGDIVVDAGGDGGSTELVQTAKQGVQPTANLPITYSTAKQREFHVIAKADIDPNQVAKNFKVLKGCIKDVRDFVVEAEMRLHRAPTVRASRRASAS